MLGFVAMTCGRLKYKIESRFLGSENMSYIQDNMAMKCG